VALDPDPDRYQAKNFPAQPDLDTNNAELEIKYGTSKVTKTKIVFKTMILNTFKTFFGCFLG
jgi:hypothetical protein